MVNVVRTAGGKRKGRPSGIHAADLDGACLSAIADRTDINPVAIDNVIMGCVKQAGEQFVAFSIANEGVIESNFGSVNVEMLGEGNLSVICEAAIEAMDEAIMNALFAGETMIGRDGTVAPGLPIDEVCEILRRHGRLVDVN